MMWMQNDRSQKHRAIAFVETGLSVPPDFHIII